MYTHTGTIRNAMFGRQRVNLRSVDGYSWESEHGELFDENGNSSHVYGSKLWLSTVKPIDV